MNQPEFVISFTDLYSLNAIQVKDYLLNASKKALADLRVFDLTIGCQSLTSAGGIYIFFDQNGDCLYVGKATSRSFIERIPAHFDPRSDAWFATFPNRVLSYNLAVDYSSALEFCLNCSLLLIQFSTNQDCGEYAPKLETYLRSLLQPKLNSPKRLKKLFNDEVIRDYLNITSSS